MNHETYSCRATGSVRHFSTLTTNCHNYMKKSAETLLQHWPMAMMIPKVLMLLTSSSDVACFAFLDLDGSD